MNKEQLIEILKKLPDGTPIRTQSGQFNDDSYNVKVRVFTSSNGISAYICDDYSSREHYNFPENYSGVTEVTDEILR